MTNIRDYVHQTSGRVVWHGDNDLELQCAQWLFGEAGTALIVAPSDKVLIYKQVEVSFVGYWLTDPEYVKIGPGNKVRTTGPPYPNNLRLFEAELHDYKGGEAEGTKYIPVIDDISAWAQGVGEDYDWVVWLVAAIIIIIIVVGLYVAAAKATRGG